ncbi:chitinase [Verticillium dahliae VdLs.17]|uniref:Chitinase n=1 Tax=Verticillium dahliae (strain VdLs.17 / ATCC MYA-4575 / FGSC 10137) TaxID=498257 RepID=G2X9K6_VERDV|nr:chitinase [Verticillium dahliae VdLs.17]EGY15674.1 chitinase [Verticillium dahliae VdLs.17]KAH6697682.1 chitinase [Verticillium dahliae]
MQLCSLVSTIQRVAIISLLLSGCLAKFCAESKNNVVLYWGQGPNQLDLIHYCQQSHVDVIILSFVHLFPAQANGFLGINFGNQCGRAVFPGPGFHGVNEPRRDALLANCPAINAQIPVCQQTYGKKIILSVGGGMLSYQLTGIQEADLLADQLWVMFGPRNETLVAQGVPRPLDFKDQAVECIVPDANMASMISAAAFDIIFIQFYNTPHCSAASWAKANTSWLSDTPSKDAAIYITLPGSPEAANLENYISPYQAGNLINSFYCRSKFGGMAVWEATYSENNRQHGYTYHAFLKKHLVAVGNYPGGCRVGQQCDDSLQDRLIPSRQTQAVKPSPSATPVGEAPNCGPSKGVCSGGECCSQYNYCGLTEAHCGSGCQGLFGHCGTQPAAISPPANAQGLPISSDGSCGAGKATCRGYGEHQCCSQYGYCGSTTEYCGQGCQAAFGLCE